VLYSEISDDGIEIRKVDEYRDGHLDFADATQSTGTTFLSGKTMSPVEEIAKQGEFRLVEIAKDAFEQVW